MRINKGKKGTILLYTMLLIGAILTIGFSLTAIFIRKIRVSRETINSVTAFYVADSGVEWFLYNRSQDPSFNLTSVPTLPMPTFNVPGVTLETEENVANGTFKSVGVFRGLNRAVEIRFPP